jgi:hypothetical protein
MICPKCGQENTTGAIYCNRCGATLSASVAAAVGVGPSLGRGWRTLRQHFADLFLAVIVYLALVIPVVVALGLVLYYTTPGPFIWDTEHVFAELSWQFHLANSIINIVYYIPLAFGLFFVFLAAVRVEKIRLGDIFASFRNYGEILMAGVVFVIVSDVVPFLLSRLTEHFPVLGVLLYVAWFIFYVVLVCKLVFVPPLLIDRRMKFFDALGESWKMTRGHEWQIFGIGILFVLMFAAVGALALLISLIFIVLPVALFIGLIIGVIGFLFLFIWLLATYASLFQAVSGLYVASPSSPSL